MDIILLLLCIASIIFWIAFPFFLEWLGNRKNDNEGKDDDNDNYMEDKNGK